jgi:hypothetical protein
MLNDLSASQSNLKPSYRKFTGSDNSEFTLIELGNFKKEKGFKHMAANSNVNM